MKQETSIDMSAVAVVIPCYNTANSIENVVAGIPADVGQIVCVNDASTDKTAEILEDLSKSNSRLNIVNHDKNGGVGAAMVSGYRKAVREGAEIIVKIDGDGQMDPTHIPALIAPIASGEADYVKGNRFFDIDKVRAMPTVRLIGNAGLSFMTKLSSGYWDLFDPTNGYTAIHRNIVSVVPLDKLHKRYFFESDILFRLGAVGARVVDIPMDARYADETSHLSVFNALMTFPVFHTRNFLKRIIYNYYLRGFSVASLSLLASLFLLLFGLVFGITAWNQSQLSGNPATAGTVMLSAMPMLIGFQLLLSFLQHDVAMVPQNAIHPRLSSYKHAPTPETGESN